jgi:hypothetical protein
MNKKEIEKIQAFINEITGNYSGLKIVQLPESSGKKASHILA